MESSQEDGGLSLHDLYLFASVIITLVTGSSVMECGCAGAFKAHDKYTWRVYSAAVVFLNKWKAWESRLWLSLLCLSHVLLSRASGSLCQDPWRMLLILSSRIKVLSIAWHYFPQRTMILQTVYLMILKKEHLKLITTWEWVSDLFTHKTIFCQQSN